GRRSCRYMTGRASMPASFTIFTERGSSPCATPSTRVCCLKAITLLGEQIAGGIGPDIIGLRVQPSNGPPASGIPKGATAASVLPPRVRVTARNEPEKYVKKQRTVVIRHVSGDRIVALLEIIPWGNKRDVRVCAAGSDFPRGLARRS